MDFLEWAAERVLPKALQSRSGWTQLFEHYRSESPHIHQIEPTNLCNYNCMMCPRGESMTRKIGYMDMHLYKEAINEISTFPDGIKKKGIELFHFGESLFHPDIIEMIEYASQSGLNPILSINPALLTEQQINLILDSQPASLIISLDSLNEKNFKAIRGPKADLNRAIQNTELLLKRNRNIGIKITIRMIVMDINYHETEQFRQFWHERGGHVDLRDFFPWNSSSLAELGEFKKYPPFMPCPFPWQYMVVQWNGDVVPCCRDYNAEIVLGNIGKSSLKEIWSSPQYESFREKMSSGKNLPQCCTECLSLYYTESPPLNNGDRI